MNRRGFFATLFAPLVARLFPQPKQFDPRYYIVKLVVYDEDLSFINDGLNPEWDGTVR